MKRRAWERLQTVLAVLLTLSLTGLTFAFWLLDAPIQWDSAGPAAAAARALGLITPPPATVDIPRDLQYGEAARPVRVVWSENGQRSAVQLDTALTDSAYDRLKDSLGQALGSAKTAARRTFDDWEHALSSDSLYLEYASALPLRSLALWLSSENTALPDLSARRLALVAADGSIALWFLDARDNTPYMCPTALPARDIPGVVPSGALPCRFGYEDAAFPRAPMVLLFERTPSPPEASCTPVSLSPPDTDAFLRALHINPDTNERYSIEEETTYLDDKRACRFSPDGTIHYTAPAATNRPASPLASPRLAEAIEQARELLAALSPLLGQARFSLDSAVPSPDGSAVTVTFVYELAGLTVCLSDGQPPAVFVFENGWPMQADVRVLSFSLGSSVTDLLPEKNVYRYLTSGHPYGNIELRLFYLESDGTLTAGWENF